jgi:hypothetical protein
MPNHLSVEDDVISLIFEGDQTEAAFIGIAQETEMLVNEAKAAGRPANVLVNVKKVGKVTLAVRQLAAGRLRKWPLHRVAIFGANTYLRHLTNLVIMATGNRGTKVFNTEKEARAWLKL